MFFVVVFVGTSYVMFLLVNLFFVSHVGEPRCMCNTVVMCYELYLVYLSHPSLYFFACIYRAMKSLLRERERKRLIGIA